MEIVIDNGDNNIEANKVNSSDLEDSILTAAEEFESREESFQYVENDLYHLLNETLKGRVILGRYMKTKFLDRVALKDLIIYHEISKNPLMYKIKTDRFIVLKADIITLFQSEKEVVVFESPYASATGQISARGYLYNHYKIVKRHLRLSGISIADEADLNSDAYMQRVKKFCDTWPTVASKIMKVCLSSKCQEIKRFVLKHQSLIKEGAHNSILALLLISFSPKVNKKKKLGDSVKPLSKEEISQFFILHIEDPRSITEVRSQFEKRVEELGYENHPYIIFCGHITQIQACICINSEIHNFLDPLKAVETCYKCPTALQSFPPVAEFAWSVIDVLVYDFSFKSINAHVCNFVQAVKNISI